MKINKLTVKHFFGYSAMILVSVIVMAFLGLHSLTFFQFTFPDDQSIYAYLGFGLTSGGVVLYLVMLVTVSDTPMKKFIAIAMLLVSVAGEMLTAGFGMQVETWKSGGFELTQEDFKNMILVVQLLGILHGVALIGHIAGGAVMNAFADDDGDGIPNIVDKEDNHPGFRTFPSTTDASTIARLEKRIAELENHPTKGQ